MCFDEKTSWITFICGSIINLIIITYLLKKVNKNKNYIIPLISIFIWQYALFMQIPDALAWHQINMGKSPNLNIGKTAAILNFTQPIMVILGVILMYILLKKKFSIILYIGIILMFIYVTAVILYHKNNYNVDPGKKCRSLSYSWWNSKIKELTILYGVVIILGMLCIPHEVKTPYWSIINISIFLISILVTRIISYYYENKGYGQECNSGSLWCWTVAFAGLIIFMFVLINR